MGRKRRADAIDTGNDSNKESEVSNGTAMTGNENMIATTQISTASTAAGQQPVTAAKTSVATVVATPGSAVSTDHPKAKVPTIY